MWDDLFASADLLQKGINAGWTRNQVIRNNIANAETPNFKSSEVVFESFISDALYREGVSGRKTRAQHLDIGKISDVRSVSAQVLQMRDNQMRMDENNVDVEAEQAKLAKNSIQYNTLVEKLNSELNRIKLAVTEGR